MRQMRKQGTEEKRKPKMPEPIGDRITKVLKEKTPMPDTYGTMWYRQRELDFMFRDEFKRIGEKFVPVLVDLLATNGNAMVRRASAKMLGEISANVPVGHSIHLQAEGPLLHASKHDPNPDVRHFACEAASKVQVSKRLAEVLSGHGQVKGKSEGKS